MESSSIGIGNDTMLSDACSQWRRSCVVCEDPVSKKSLFRSQARQFFTQRAKVERNKERLEEDLATVVEQLGPALTGKYASRICALHCLCGAIEGCGTTLSLSTRSIHHLGPFLVGQCVPVSSQQEEIDNQNHDYDEQVRDAAATAVGALVRCPWSINYHDATEVLESIQTRLEYARSGVENRCAGSDNAHTGYEHGVHYSAEEGCHHNPNDILIGNLSNLPRFSRSVCFTLLQSAVSGITDSKQYFSPNTVDTIAPRLEKALLSFTMFSISCLQGESDPRCIMQLLVYFQTVQTTFSHFFLAPSLSSSMFPVTALFDGVAPYYPIQFTPPPNDIHGITRDGLRSALMSILCNFSLDPLAKRDSKDTMQSLALGIVLERLIASEDGDTSELAQTAVEKLDAVEELTMMVLPKGYSLGGVFNSISDSESNGINDYDCSHLNADIIRQVSKALITVHEQSSMYIAMGGGEESDAYKMLADTCRSVVSKVAFLVEHCKDTDMWEAFVLEPLNSLSKYLSSHLTRRRQMAISYMACLAASGGPESLRCSLEYGLDPLVESLKDRTAVADSEEDIFSTAAYGIGAFFSSCRVALKASESNNVVLSPHPLDPYSGRAFKGLYDLFQDETLSLPTRIAAVRALESVLIITPTKHFGIAEERIICMFIEMLTASVLDTTRLDASTNVLTSTNVEEAEWRKASTQTLGGILGTALGNLNYDESARVSDDSNKNGNCIERQQAVAVSGCTSALQSEMIRTLVLRDIFPKLVSSAKNPKVRFDSARFDRIALALACNISFPGATLIIELLLRSLKSCLKQKSLSESFSSTEACADAVSFVLRHGGYTASKALHELKSPKSVTPHEICEILAKIVAPDKNRKAGLLVQRMTALRLPATEEERVEADEMINRVFGIVSRLLPAYHRFVPQTKISDLVTKVVKVIPPLSDNDNIKLFITLPLLSASLKHYHSRCENTNDMIDKLISIGPDLVVFALNADYDPRARSAAASIVYSSIAQSELDDMSKCPAFRLFRVGIEPIITAAVHKLVPPHEKNTKEENDINHDTASITNSTSIQTDQNQTQSSELGVFINCLNIAALVGTAAACRGGNSLATADIIASFLLELACTKRAAVPFSDSGTKISFAHLSLREHGADACGLDITLVEAAAVSAFGSMMAYEDASPLWRQRLTHRTLKQLQHYIDEYLETTINDANNNSMPSISIPSTAIGPLGICCHIICSSSIFNSSKTTQYKIALLVKSGLNPGVFYTVDTNTGVCVTRAHLIALKRICLSSLLKLLCDCPILLSNDLDTIVMGLLRAYAITKDANDTATEITSKLLALQALERVPTIHMARQTLLAVRPAVLSILSAAMNHPSRLLRQAAVQAKNSWCIHL